MTSTAQLKRIITTWKKRLGLLYWRIDLDLDEVPEDDGYAAVWASTHYLNAKLRLAEDWREWDTQRLNAIVVHELLHLLHRDVDRSVISIEDQTAEGLWELFQSRYDHELEGFVDALAACLVDSMGVV